MAKITRTSINSRKSTIILKYNEKNATEKITNDLENFSWTDCASGEADTISITLNNKSLKWLKGSWFPQSTDYIKMSIRVNHWRWQKDNRTVYCGKFAVDELEAGGFPSTITIGGISVPIHTGFNVTQRNKTYKKTSLRAILAEIAKRADISLVFSGDNHKIDEVSQEGKTDMEFAFSLCSDYDLSMKVYNGKLVVYDQTDYEKRKKSFTLDRSDLGDSGAYHFMRAVTKAYDGVKLQYQNKDGKNITYRYVVPGKKGKRLLVLSVSAESHGDAEKKAKAKLAANLRQTVTATFKLMGDPRYQACKVFELTGFGKFDGRYFIDKAVHEKSGGYFTTIQCHRCVTNIK